jgi:dephospho-CoA kinase
MKKYIAIVGTIAAGKTTAAAFFHDKFGFVHYKLSQAIYDEADRLGVDRHERTVLQDLGDKLREEYGVSALAIKAIEMIGNNPDKRFVLESIRNHNEVIKLKQELQDDLIVISVDAPIKDRYQRAVAREGQYKEQNLSFEEFETNDTRDLGIGNKDNEQNVAKCMELAEVHIQNTKTPKDFEDNLLKAIN